MTLQRTQEVFNDFRAALHRLCEAYGESVESNSLAVDGTIQRFEFTFELAWKCTMKLLAFHGIQARSPRMVIKEAYKLGIIDDGDGWLVMLEDRNKTAHLYDELQAKMIYETIKSTHLSLLTELKDAIEKDWLQA